MIKNELLKSYKLLKSLGYYPKQLKNGDITNDTTLGLMLSVNHIFKVQPGTIYDSSTMYPMVDVSDWYPTNSKINGLWD